MVDTELKLGDETVDLVGVWNAAKVRSAGTDWQPATQDDLSVTFDERGGCRIRRLGNESTGSFRTRGDVVALVLAHDELELRGALKIDLNRTPPARLMTLALVEPDDEHDGEAETLLCRAADETATNTKMRGVEVRVAPDEEGEGGGLVLASEGACRFILFDRAPGSTDVPKPRSFLEFQSKATDEDFAQARDAGLFATVETMDLGAATKITRLGDLGALGGLRRVVVNNAKFTEWSDLYTATGLTSLRLGKKCKGDLPDGIARVAGLRQLEIDMAAIASLPADLGELALETLLVTSKKITTLPELDLDALKTLVVEAPLGSIDPNLARVPDLKLYLKQAAAKTLTEPEIAEFGPRLSLR